MKLLKALSENCYDIIIIFCVCTSNEVNVDVVNVIFTLFNLVNHAK